MAAPLPETMKRDGEKALPIPPIVCCGIQCCRMKRESLHHAHRNEAVFYDSAVAQRTMLGRLHHCMSCPGWSKATSERVVYSRWELLKLKELPGHCIRCTCVANRDEDWLPPDPAVFRTETGRKREEDACCVCRVPCGRTLDTFDADIIVDASAHQTLCQICRGEGDLVLYRKAGADLSDPSEVFVVTDVVKPFDVFNEVTFELSKINLRGATAAALGQRMGATIWNFDARAGAEGPAVATDKGWRGERETVYYDSRMASRTCFGQCCHQDLCCPHEYRVTSERVTYTRWDLWYLCDEPLTGGFCCVPCYACRGCMRECCCAIGAANIAESRRKRATELERAKQAARTSKRGCVGEYCACPVGRTAHYFDIDIVADVRAHQSCWQLCLNEGSLEFGRVPGGDASHGSSLASFFRVRDVPEVFAHFDEFSYELSKLDLKHFRQNVMRNEMVQGRT